MATKNTGDIEIGGRLFNTATGNIVAGADAIKDEEKNRYQNDINSDVVRHESEIHGDNGINDRLDDLEAMEQIVIDGGEAQIAQGDAFNYTDAEHRAMIPTVGAIQDGLDDDGAFDVSAKYPTSGVEEGNTYTLQGALTVLNANLPTNKKKGGMSIKFVQSSDNKYIQARCMAQNFTTDVSQWQGVDKELTQNSNNLIESGAVAKVVGTSVQLGTDAAKTIPYEIVEGKTYYFRNNKPANTGYVPVYVRETENGANVLLFNLLSGETKKYIADTNYHYIRCATSANPVGTSDYEVFEGESVNGELQTHDDIINQHTTEIQGLQNDNPIHVRLGIIPLVQGTIRTGDGKLVDHPNRVRSDCYINGNCNLKLPEGFIFNTIVYYNASTHEYDSYSVSGTRFATVGKNNCVAKFVVTKTDNTQPITPEEVLVVTEPNDKINSAFITIATEKTRAEGAEQALQQNIDSVESQLSDIQTCEAESGASAVSLPCEMRQGHVYKVYNDSAETNYFSLSARVTSTGESLETISASLGWHTSVEFTPQADYHFIRVSAGYQNRAPKVVVTDLGTLDARVTTLENKVVGIDTNAANISKNKAQICIDEIALEQGSIGSADGNNQPNAKRIRSINYLYGGYDITLPSGFKIQLVAYYDKTDNSYVGFKQPLVPNYTVLSTLTKDGVEHFVKARVAITKADNTQNITPEDIKKSFSIEELYSKTKTNETNITSLGNRVASVETKANNTADIVKNIQICETAGTATANALCIMLAGHTYKVTNTSDNHYNYFMVYARETATSDNIPVTTSALAWGQSVMFTPDVNCQYIRMSAGYQSNPCRVDVEDVSTHEYRITQLENWKPAVDNHLSQLDAKLNVTKHIYLGDIQYNLNTCSGWVRGTVPAPLYAEQLYDALVAAYPGYITKIDCKADSGIEVPAYYSNTVKDDYGNYLTLPFPMYHFKPISYGDSLVKVFLTGGVHGEAIGVNSLYHFCKVLCEEATEDIKKLKYGIDLYVMPYCNPSTPFIQQKGYEWEGQTMHPNTSGRLNWNLVNINRNMPTSGWTLTQQYTDQGQPYQDYSGPTAGSEYESQLIMHYANLIQPDIMMDCHNSDIIGDNTPERASQIWILRNATNSYISRITRRVSEDVCPKISKMIQASDENFPADNMLKLVCLDYEPVGRAVVQNWFAETFNIPAYTTEGAQRFPYDDGVLIPIADRINDVTDPRFTRYQELAIEAVIKRTIQELYG